MPYGYEGKNVPDKNVSIHEIQISGVYSGVLAPGGEMKTAKTIVLPQTGNARSYQELLEKCTQLEQVIEELHRYLYIDLMAIEKRLDDGGI